jgi:hypothetical protein
MLRRPAAQQGKELGPAISIEVDDFAVEDSVGDVKRTRDHVAQNTERLVRIPLPGHETCAPVLHVNQRTEAIVLSLEQSVW